MFDISARCMMVYTHRNIFQVSTCKKFFQNIKNILSNLLFSSMHGINFYVKKPHILLVYWRSNFKNKCCLSRENQSWSLCESGQIFFEFTNWKSHLITHALTLTEWGRARNLATKVWSISPAEKHVHPKWTLYVIWDMNDSKSSSSGQQRLKTMKTNWVNYSCI
jgi:hypothetical protein